MKNRKPALPDEIDQKITELLTHAGNARRNGNARKWSSLRNDAWALLPEPKEEWDFHPQTMSRGAVEVIPELGLCDELDVWIDRMYLTHFDLERKSEYTNLIAGHALFQCGRKEEALALFKQVLQHHGKEWFMGDYQPYLNLIYKKPRFNFLNGFSSLFK